MRAFAVCLLLPCFGASAPQVLFLGARSNHVAKGLGALRVLVEHTRVSDLVSGEPCLFDYSVLVCGMDVRRGRTSITVRVEVEAMRRSGDPVAVTSADVTYVNVDDSGKPRPLTI